MSIVTDEKYYNSGAFMILTPGGKSPVLSQSDLEFPLDRLDQIHDELKTRIFPNCAFPFSGLEGIDQNWDFIAANLRFNFFYCNRKQPLVPVFKDLLKQVDTVVCSISYGEHNYGLIKTNDQLFIYDPAKLYRFISIQKKYI